MASTIPVATTRGVGEKSRSRRIGTLLEFSRGEPPLTAQKGAESFSPTASGSSQSRAQTSRIPQNPSARKLTTQAETRVTRPPLTHETQSWSTSSRSGIAKPMAIVGGYAEPSKQPRNVLRRKKSTMLKEPSSIHGRNASRSDSGRTGSSSSITQSQTSLDPVSSLSDRSMTESPAEILVAQQVETHRPMAQPAHIYPELDRYRDIQVRPSRDVLGRGALYRLATEDLPPPTPQFSGASSHSQLSIFSASPSTRFSESPGTGPYSRDTTPTSICSQSPGLVAPMRLPAARVRQASPAETRPPVTRRRAGSLSNEGGSFSADPHGLAAVREALTSSSSNSTVRTEEKKHSKGHRGCTPAPPNPPPRSSSQKFKKGQSTDETYSSFRSSQIPPRSVTRSPSPTKLIKSTHNRTPSAVLSPQLRSTPPARPSRDGTPDLNSQFGGPVPIIHSNLSSTSLTERRLSGQLQLNSLPRSITPGSTRPSFSREPTPAPRSGNPLSSQVSKSDTRKPNRTPSPSVPTFRSKFSLFGRRTKADPEVIQTEKKQEKVLRKGPVAGTGHEGYGRIGAVKRRSSTASNLRRGLPGLVSSSESLTSTLSVDPFLLERMNPVIIAGGEVVENQNNSSDLIRTESHQNVPRGRPSLDSRNPSATSLGAKEKSRQTLWPSPFPQPSIHPRRPSDSSDSEAVTMKSTLAHRRSIRGLQSQPTEQFNIPKPISTRPPSAASMATTIHTDDSFPDIQSEQDHGLPPVVEPVKKLTNRAKSPRKWNIFGRSQADSSSRKQADNMSATVRPSQHKPMAFYTMMDSPEQGVGDHTQDSNTVPGKAEVLATADVTVTSDRGPLISNPAVQAVHVYPAKDSTSIPDKLSDAIPRIWQLNKRQEQRQIEHETTGNFTSRPSRLPQVGRIPKVVTSRPRQTSPKSFSRPFNRISIQLPPAQSIQLDQDSVAKGPSPPRSLALRTIRAESPGETVLSARLSKDQTTHDEPTSLERPGQEFLAFPPRKSSECTTSSESSYVRHTAQIPEPSAPLEEDEVWDEYNDLLEDAPPSPTSSCGIPFPLETYHSKLVKKSAKPLESPTIITEVVEDVRISVATAKTATTSSHCSADMTARINAAFRFDSDPPATPFSIAEFVSGYGNRNSSKIQPNQEANVAVRHSSSSDESEKVKVGSKRSSAGSKRSSGSSRLSEVTPLSQVNLRVGSMTVSKWLTFGHVLFSPVREDLVNDDGSLKRQSILVVDGLGNDDWSFYAAETYPAATFFNLSPRPPLPQEHQAVPSFPLSPPNHHQIQFTSHADKFPFGPNSFTAVVFRFPSAAPEAHYRNVVSEAQRVLKPGGFIELSILDVDLNNMGNRTRRAVRRLKEQVTAQNSDFNLSSTADLILRLLGKKGFVDIKTCRVGVPVASSLTNAPKKTGEKDERSLAEMMNDETELGDENITKMVSKVGRWWYNRCYEVPTGMSSSIWNDRALLAECEEWNTSLKLMVCHARIPEDRGRVASI